MSNSLPEGVTLFVQHIGKLSDTQQRVLADVQSIVKQALSAPMTGSRREPGGGVPGILPGDAELRHLEAVFEQAAVGIALVGLGGEWQRANPMLCDTLGCAHERLLRGRSIWSVIHPDDIAKHFFHTARLLSGEVSTGTLDLRYLRPDGSTVQVRQAESLLRDERLRPLFTLVVIEKASTSPGRSAR